MKEQRMYDTSVYHLCAGPNLEEYAVYYSYDDYIVGFMQLKVKHKGTRYLYTIRKGKCYHYYLRVVDVK